MNRNISSRFRKKHSSILESDLNHQNTNNYNEIRSCNIKILQYANEYDLKLINFESLKLTRWTFGRLHPESHVLLFPTSILWTISIMNYNNSSYGQINNNKSLVPCTNSYFPKSRMRKRYP